MAHESQSAFKKYEEQKYLEEMRYFMKDNDKDDVFKNFLKHYKLNQDTNMKEFIKRDKLARQFYKSNFHFDLMHLSTDTPLLSEQEPGCG